jgi:flagellar FliL protein
MADKKGPDDDEAAPAAPKSGGKGKTIALIAIGALALVGVSIAGTVFLTHGNSGGDEEVAADEADADTAKTDKKSKKAKKGKKDKGAKEEKKAAGVSYLPLEPPFVVNFQKPQEARFLQISMEVMTKEAGTIEDVKKHMPAIRNSIVLLLSSQTQEALATPEGKETLRAAALAEIQKILQEFAGKPAVEAVYFTGFVMQ